jgi:hypothetical protein
MERESEREGEGEEKEKRERGYLPKGEAAIPCHPMFFLL